MVLKFTQVATREGGVDRNWSAMTSPRRKPASPPARVAWIETPGGAALWQTLTVATREGGVDRNPESCTTEHTHRARRHPRGWRG